MLEVGGDDALGGLPEIAGETAKCGHEEGEDHEEDDVGSERADHVDEAQNSHVQLEVGESRSESWVGRAGSWISRIICDRCIVEWRESCGESQPEGAERAENHERECVAQDEFKERAKDHQETAEEVVGTTESLSIIVTRGRRSNLTLPLHRDHLRLSSQGEHWKEVRVIARNRPEHWIC